MFETTKYLWRSFNPTTLIATDRYSDQDRKYVAGMLHTIQNDLDTKYFDPTFHGVDIKARFQEAEAGFKTPNLIEKPWRVGMGIRGLG